MKRSTSQDQISQFYCDGAGRCVKGLVSEPVKFHHPFDAETQMREKGIIRDIGNPITEDHDTLKSDIHFLICFGAFMVTYGFMLGYLVFRVPG